MRKFIVKIVAFGFIFCSICALLLSVQYFITNRTVFIIPKDKHILFMGASQTNRTFDDSIIDGSLNVGYASERYMYTYLKLNKLLCNEQIDTIFLECAPTDLWKHCDDKYYSTNEGSDFLPKYWPLFGKEEWSVFKNVKLQTLDLITTKLLSIGNYRPEKITENIIGGFAPLDVVIDTTMVKYGLIEGYSGNSVNHKYLRKIIDLCKENDIKLYFVYCPMYKPDYYYNQKEYYEIYNKQFSDIELIDYSALPLELNMRYDANHVNREGAKYVTNYLKSQQNLER